MWNDNKSLILSKACVILFMALLIICIIAVPILIGDFIYSAADDYKDRYLADSFAYEDPGKTSTDAYIRLLTVIPVVLFRLTIYAGAVPAGAILILLYILLGRIGRGELFVEKNTQCLRHISLCCFIGALICFVSAFYWMPWSAVGVAAAFMGLIVRVIKNVVAKAVSLQTDADLTV